MSSWIEEHLAHQQPDGSLYDWVSAGPPSMLKKWAPQARVVYLKPGVRICADRNSVEADQESSAVIAAARVLAITGDRTWLQKDVAGRSLRERCDDALTYLWQERRDARTGLITSGFTADWGDVTPVYPDQRAIYLDEKTPRVVGLYTNALAYQAARALATMHEAAGDHAAADRWWADAEWLKTAVEITLWKQSRGFYRMHVSTAAPRVDTGDADVLAMGGHAAALGAGLVDPARAALVLDALDARRREMNLPTISFTLLPPLPAGLFQHPAVKEPWTYQNGGQWDWFGGRLVLAEFEYGRAARASEHLVELARKAQQSGGLFEWHTRDGQGRGSPQYAGSAGALGTAILEGLLGIRLSAERLELKPRLGVLSAQVRLHEPATGTGVEYDYRPSADEIVFTFAVTPPRATSVAVLLPPSWTEVEARLGARELSTKKTHVGTDSYAVFETDGRRSELHLRPLRPR